MTPISKENDNTDFIVGNIYQLPVLSFTPYNKGLGFLCDANGKKIRVNSFPSQLGTRPPKTIPCRLLSVNALGFPFFEQVSNQDYQDFIQKNKNKRNFSETHANQKKQTSGDTDSNTPSLLDYIISASKKDVSIHQELKIESVIEKNTKEPENESEKISKKLLDLLSSKTNLSFSAKTHNDDFSINPLIQKNHVHKLSDFLWDEKYGDFKSWFINTGGVLDRYLVLLDLAEKLLEYHVHDKIYKNLSADKVTVKYNDDIPFVELPLTGHYKCDVSNIYIDGNHSAPEVARCQFPNTQMSDSYAFGLIAHHILAFLHPFHGDFYLNGTAEDRDRANKGFMPWIEDPNDKSNRITYKSYDNLFVTDKLLQLFHKTFEEGRFSVISRPSMFEWVGALKSAFQEMTFCKNCNTHFLYSKEFVCTFCDSEKVTYSEDAVSLTVGFWIKATTFNTVKNETEIKFTIEEESSTQSLLDDGHVKMIDNNYLPAVPSNNKSICQLQMGNGKVKITPFILLKMFSIQDNSLIIETQDSFSFKISNFPKGVFIATKDLNCNQQILIIRPWLI